MTPRRDPSQPVKPRTVRFEFETALGDDVSRPVNLARGNYVLEVALTIATYSHDGRPARLVFSLNHLRTTHEVYPFDLRFPEGKPGATTVARHPLRVAGGTYFLTLHAERTTRVWLRILRL